MIGEIFKPRLDAPIVFAGDEHKTVGLADLACEFFQRGRRCACRIFLVHPVQHRQADRLGVDQLDITTAAAQALDDELRQADAHAVGAVRTVEYENAVAHDISTLSCPDATAPPDGANGLALMPLEILHVAFVLFGRRARFEGAEIAALAGLRIHLSGIEPVLARLQFADHDTPPPSRTPRINRDCRALVPRSAFRVRSLSSRPGMTTALKAKVGDEIA